ncbi:MAG: hypothetical protein GX576_15675 [Thauera phenolivorans]|uniref:Cell division protein ZapB n=1 Tax=Thauera phenolivorans TaxID=1792543 RepID=A0A7X7LZJ2_9RHOO|nr:hypothetical protein [Thauera phenolivorans]NLF55806.1 hypothetical protein [Thauera phenolivorans]
MENELTQLETRIEQLIALYGKLKSENVELHARVVRVEAENRALADKLKRAADRFEAVLDKLPEA